MTDATPISYYIALSVVLFSIGAVGVLLRRNAIVIFMCIDSKVSATPIFQSCQWNRRDCGITCVAWPGYDHFSCATALPPFS